MKPKKRDKCLVTTCSAGAWIRGLCSKCYASAQGAVKHKITTWDEVEKMGLCLPRQKPSLFRAEFNKKRV